MTEMFRYLTGILEKEEQKIWKIYAVLSLVSPIVDLFSFSVIIYIINLVVRANYASPKVILFTMFMTVVSALKCFFELYKSKISNQFIYHGAQKLSMKIYELLVKEDLLEHNQKSVMQMLMMIRTDTTSCIQIIVDCIGIWVNGINMAGYTVILIYVSGWIGVASSVVLLLFMAGIFFQGRARIKAHGEKSRVHEIKANSQISIAYGSFKEMKIDDRSDFVLQKYRDASSGYAQVQGKFKYKINSVSVILQNSIMTILFAVLAVILFAGGNLASILAPMIVYITALVRMLPMAYAILSGMNHVEFAKKPYATLKENFIKYTKLKEEEQKSKNIRQKKLTLKKGVFVKNLTFGYNNKKRIFQDASIEIPVGYSIAVIGVSGVGKTTFLDLLLGLLKPQSGHILFDDYDIVTHMDEKGVCRASMGEIVSYIPQTVYLNGETIRNNVAFFENEREINNDRIVECLKCAQIWEDVDQMPDGVDTLIGENGTAISGGQRQRIALARALYKDFELLVMDEATAALDMETEKAVIDSIRQVKGDKTLLIVTHHMSLANECDIIYKIEDQKIIRVR